MTEIAVELEHWSEVFLRQIEQRDPGEARELRAVLAMRRAGHITAAEYDAEMYRSRARQKAREPKMARPFPTRGPALDYATWRRNLNLARLERDPNRRTWPTDAETSAAAEGREEFYRWYGPLCDEFDTLAELVNRLDKLCATKDRPLIGLLVARGTALHDSVLAQLRSDLLPWLPMHLGKFGNVLVAWTTLRNRIEGR